MDPWGREIAKWVEALFKSDLNPYNGKVLTL